MIEVGPPEFRAPRGPPGPKFRQIPPNSPRPRNSGPTGPPRTPKKDVQFSLSPETPPRAAKTSHFSGSGPLKRILDPSQACLDLPGGPFPPTHPTGSAPSRSDRAHTPRECATIRYGTANSLSRSLSGSSQRPSCPGKRPLSRDARPSTLRSLRVCSVADPTGPGSARFPSTKSFTAHSPFTSWHESRSAARACARVSGWKGGR